VSGRERATLSGEPGLARASALLRLALRRQVHEGANDGRLPVPDDPA
jgi:hypothetical protein